MKFLIASTLVLLATAPALAQQTTIFADNEAANAATPAQDDSGITLEGFSGGVSTTDAHDGGGAMVIQMLMPNTASAITGTPGPFVARPAVTGTH
jgi:hypothetical protein